MARHTMKPEVDLCVVGKCTPQDDTHQVYALHMYMHHLHTDRTYSYHWRQKSAIPLFSQLFQDTRVAVLSVSGSLATGTRDLSPATSRWFLMVLGGTAGAKCAWISSLDAVRATTIARTMLSSRTWSTGMGMLMKAATHHWYIVSNMCSNLSICPSSFPQF